MALAAKRSRTGKRGHGRPRIAPPRPLRHGLAEYRQIAESIGIDPMPWQDVAATYATALGPDDLWLYREFAAVVSRQQGKTTFTKPLIVGRLLAGRRVMHIAQLRELPRIMFESIADIVEEHNPDLLPRRRGKVIYARRGAGSESIVLNNGGEYRISAAISGGRGFSFDDLLIDELREMNSFDVINAAKPAQRFSENPQTIYLSNAGTDESVILNSLAVRAAANDPSLAYLEWSADPAYDAGDIRGWLQSNPAIGHYPQVLRDLEQDYRAAVLAGNLAGFETEALCRRQPSMRERLVDEYAFAACAGPVGDPRQPVMAVSMTPDGRRAAVAIAWQRPDGSVSVALAFDVTGSPIDTAKLGADIDKEAKRLGVKRVGYDPLTDAELVKYVSKSEKVAGQVFANASAQFVNLVNAKRLRYQDAGSLVSDIALTSRKSHDDTGHFQAVRMADDRPIPAALAAIRAVWLASGPVASSPRVY